VFLFCIGFVIRNVNFWIEFPLHATILAKESIVFTCKETFKANVRHTKDLRNSHYLMFIFFFGNAVLYRY